MPGLGGNGLGRARGDTGRARPNAAVRLFAREAASDREIDGRVCLPSIEAHVRLRRKEGMGT
jgi:hypothetical protein